MSLLGTSPDIGFTRKYPYEKRELTRATRRGPMPARKWRRFLRRWGDYRYYAEKAGSLDLSRLPDTPVRLVNVVRDPRDVWSSTLAFDEQRGYYGFGRSKGQSRESFLETFVQRVQSRTDRMCREAGAMTVRYEDLATSLDGTVSRLGEWLEVDLVPARIEDHPDHRTSAGVAESIGRWRRDLPAPEIDLLTGRLQPVLERYGYPVD